MNGEFPFWSRFLAGVLTISRWALGSRGAFNLCGHWQRLGSWKECRCALLLTLLGEPWVAGPTVHRLRADLALLRRRLALEVRSFDEARKLSPARLRVFREAGWSMLVVHGVRDLLDALRRFPS